MTGYKDDEFTFNGYDMQTIQENNQWIVYIYKDGEKMGRTSHTKKKHAIEAAKSLVTTGKPYSEPR
mgnify:CR=1 FL=1